MKLDLYIIHRGAPESRLLSSLGFDRKILPTNKWKGRSRSRGGYGKAPVEWRIEGESNVKKLCTGIIRIIGSKPQEQRTSEEQIAFDRAKRTLAAFDSRAQRIHEYEHAAAKRSPAISKFLKRFLPLASEEDIILIMEEIKRSAPNSMREIKYTANMYLSEQSSAWNKARKDFVLAMKENQE